MDDIKRLIRTNTIRIKIRRELGGQDWPDITQLVANSFPRLIHAFEKADASFQEKTSAYPLEYYELFVHPAVVVLPLEEANELIRNLEEETSMKVSEGSFRVCFGGKHYTISVEYPCG